MPITSHQISSYIGGQQAMFGNFASYAQQITPGGGQGPMPTYPNPMAGVQEPQPHPLTMSGSESVGTSALSAMGNIGMPAMASAAMIGGSFLPGAAGRMMGSLDPFSAGLGGFARGAGLRAGGQGIMANMGRIASGGAGSIARAGMAGIGGAAIAAAPIMALGAAAQYGVGQMVEGAQFNAQGRSFLNQNFRQTNAQSETGFGFSRRQGDDIMDTVRQMGSKEMMSSPQEMRRIMEQGTGMGMFRAVQDAKEFKTKFKEMVSSLKEIATTMNTTLEGAIPFLQGARQMGFWTPQDISRNAQMTRQTAAATGMSVAQTQGMMSQGAGMARQIGALGAHGAEGMARSLQHVGGALRSGVLSEQRLSELTGGLQGSEAVQAMAGKMQAQTTRFASSNVARWMIAGLGRNNFQNLDQGQMSALISGNMTIGQIGSSARGNIGRQGAFNFVANERKLRGELVRQGPAMEAAFLRSVAGRHMYDDSSKGQYIAQRIAQRYFGGSTEEARARIDMARSGPQIARENQQRTSAMVDQEARNRDQLMNESWEGLKRKAGGWWKESVQDPLKQMGADISRAISHAYEDAGAKLFGAAVDRYRFRGFTRPAMEAMQLRALGDDTKFKQQFASKEEMRTLTGAPTGGMGLSSILTGTRQLDVSKFLGPEAQRKLEGSLSAATSGGQIGSSSEATALGFQGVDPANKALMSAQKEMGTTAFKGQSFLLAQKTGLKGLDLGMRMAEDIRSGKMGGEALRSLVASGGSQAAYRLAAAMSPEQRERVGGIDMTGAATELGMVAGMNRKDKEAFLSRQSEEAETLIAKGASDYRFKGHLRRGFERTNVSQGEVAELLAKGGGDLKEIMTKINSGDPKATAEAKAEILAMAGDKKFSNKERTILQSMADPSANKATTAGLEQWGRTERIRNRAAGEDVIKTRMDRMRGSMKAQGVSFEKVMDGLDKAGKMGDIVRSLTSTTTLEGHSDRLEELVKAAASSDPKQAARAASLLQGFEGSEEMVAAISEGAGVGQAAKALTKRKGSIGQRINMVQVFARQMGSDMQISTGELRSLEAGGPKADKAMKQILGRMGDAPGAVKENAKKMLTAIRDRSESGLAEAGVKGATARALGLLGTPESDAFRKKSVEVRRELGAGQLGSPQGMHVTLRDIKLVLDEIKTSTKDKGLGGAGTDETI